ncbi:DUF6624 domain-containing protein [Phenylobacterium sp.]|uniref:DUF6624 domain-containing protein n=1 Tax=Phenylobacterium sp. TaxID=1871053 RepID=UPI00345C09A5
MLGLSLAATLIASSTPAAEITPADLQQCLGVSHLAAPLAAIAADRAKATAEEWATACRQAREADLRRRSAVSALLRTGTSPLRGWTSAERFSKLSRTSPDADVAELFRRAARDQGARESLSAEAQSQFAAGLSPLAVRLLRGLISNDAVAIDRENQAWLSAAVGRRGWFTISRDGASADGAAWLIVQHGDQDRAFQKRMIAVLEPLADRGETEPRRFPYLFDRWAAGAGELQRFGLQGACVGPGEWRPSPMEDETGVDARRRRLGLPTTLSEQVRQNSARCP